MLIHYGHGGVGPEGMWGDMTHEDTVAMYEAAGLTVAHTADWPGSFEDLRLVMLPAPGFKDSAARFKAGEVAQLRAFMEEGGVVVVELENSAVLNSGCVNALFKDLGFGVRMAGGWTNGTFADITEHPFTEGVKEVGVASSANITLGGETCVVGRDDACLVAVRAYGDGWLAVLADGNAISDLANWDDAGRDNRRLIRNFAGLGAE